MRQWTVRLTASAENDFQQIVDWTLDQFGDAQALAYAETLALALAALSDGPAVAGVRRRDEIAKGLRSLHIGRQGRKGRHFIMFRVAADDRAIEVLRLLHDSMDLPRHIDPSAADRETRD